MNRRRILWVGVAALLLPRSSISSFGATPQDQAGDKKGLPEDKNVDKADVMKVHYLEIVTTDVEAVCELYSRTGGITFGETNQNLGGARTAKLADGCLLGIRPPLRDTEKPIVRPYMLVNDIKAAVAAAATSGARIAMEPTEIQGYGQFAIVILGGIESGLWQLRRDARAPRIQAAGAKRVASPVRGSTTQRLSSSLIKRRQP
jgi:uncharacterized protein